MLALNTGLNSWGSPWGPTGSQDTQQWLTEAGRCRGDVAEGILIQGSSLRPRPR